MAGDNKIWIWILFAIGSVVYNYLKKKNKKRENSEGVDAAHQSREQSNWGVNDLIQQFENNYGPSEVSEANVMDEDLAEEHFETPNPVEQQPKKESLKSDSITHSSINEVVARSNRGAYDQNVSEQESDSEELDLESMVIHNAILNRPKF